MASQKHNEVVARRFLHDLMVHYLRENEAGKQLLAKHLFEDMHEQTIDKIEGPTYRVANFWEHHVEQREALFGVKTRPPV